MYVYALLTNKRHIAYAFAPLRHGGARGGTWKEGVPGARAWGGNCSADEDDKAGHGPA